jgi:adenylate cyclase
MLEQRVAEQVVQIERVSRLKRFPAEPEEVMAVMNQYHAALGSLVHEFEGTLERFLGDGIMMIFGDPIPCTDPCERAVRMAIAMRSRLLELSKQWRRERHEESA